MHADLHSMIIEHLRSENAERKIISQILYEYYMNSKDFEMRTENFSFLYRTESKMLATFKSKAAAQFSFST